MEKNTKENMIQFLSKCDEIGFENAYNKFIIENPDYKKEFLRIFFNQSVDPIFHRFTKHNQKCLYLSSEFDVGLETISNIFNEIHCHEKNDIKQMIEDRLKFLEKTSQFELEAFLKEINLSVSKKNIEICRNLRKKYKNNIMGVKPYFYRDLSFATKDIFEKDTSKIPA